MECKQCKTLNKANESLITSIHIYCTDEQRKNISWMAEHLFKANIPNPMALKRRNQMYIVRG